LQSFFTFSIKLCWRYFAKKHIFGFLPKLMESDEPWQACLTKNPRNFWCQGTTEHTEAETLLFSPILRHTHGWNKHRTMFKDIFYNKILNIQKQKQTNKSKSHKVPRPNSLLCFLDYLLVLEVCLVHQHFHIEYSSFSWMTLHNLDVYYVTSTALSSAVGNPNPHKFLSF
jgi:hypothetical protein